MKKFNKKKEILGWRISFHLYLLIDHAKLEQHNNKDFLNQIFQNPQTRQ